ncbi:transcriptional regulator [Labrys miyagiensis]|uniref:Transcriptional regulator n=1 Tax=Labrys miyagiensis TaxID=346912 RepID=A0ABQ6CGF9_9HYPH|nr:addiction module antidote protein [Labrys miyagiensis]GLS17789.1 transcriptional regulator [Labrys miyagiensis]
MAIKLSNWDPADYIKDEGDVIAHLEAAFESGDPATIAAMLGAVARSSGVAQIARKAGVSRETIYSSLTREGDPRLSTLTSVLAALGFGLSIHRVEPHELEHS